ncbi:MAG: amidohydrolase [Actinomycetia bacterium]|nr:amidohydrolase [Actinomycetes bacterium]
MGLLFVGARVLTGDPERPEAEAVWVEGDRIRAVGPESVLRRMASPAPEVIDGTGATLLPGFIDAHVHLALLGGQLNGVALKPLRSVAAVREAVRARAAATPPGTWIRGFGYNQLWLAERRHPTRDDLDPVSPRHPVLLTRTCGHIAVANTAALRAAGLAEREPDPPGGRFGRRPDGTLDGVLYDQALEAVQTVSRPGPEELRRDLAQAGRVLAEAGVVSVHDAGGPPDYFPTLIAAVDAGDVPQTVHAMVWNGLGIRQLDAFLPAGLATGFRRGRVVLGAAKVMVDGSSSGPTAATREGYAHDPADHGILYLGAEALEAVLGRAAALGFQITTHAVGDRAVALAAEVIGRVGRPERRPRIEHAAMCPPDLVPALAAAGITPVAQPRFLVEFGDGYVEHYGPERGARLFPLASWLKAGLRVAGSSDSPVADWRPLRGVAAAMTRRTTAGRVLAPEERLDFPAALALYTQHAAWVGFEEAERGRIAPGFAADLVLVEGDLPRMAPDEIAEVPVRLTVIGGTVVFGR